MKNFFRPALALFSAAIGGLTIPSQTVEAKPQSPFEFPEPLTEEVVSAEGVDSFQDINTGDVMHTDWAAMAASDIEAAFELNAAAFGPGAPKCKKWKNKHRAVKRMGRR